MDPTTNREPMPIPKATPVWNAVEVLERLDMLEAKVAALEEASIRHYVAITGTTAISHPQPSEVSVNS